MAIKFIPEDTEVSLKGREPVDKEIASLLKHLLVGLRKVELQLEKLTNEPIDEDDARTQ
jgi:hypothetical protein